MDGMRDESISYHFFLSRRFNRCATIDNGSRKTNKSKVNKKQSFEDDSSSIEWRKQFAFVTGLMRVSSVNDWEYEVKLERAPGIDLVRMKMICSENDRS